ncbi:MULTISPECIES: hypothetical protein [unclassified Bradyrhizobium]|uniref:hypothetical protein n=1 Tax=unclassified Bradyrhizobium TaxID=2631580 RepID=UPI0029166E01|nr:MULTISPECIES: hypothetical protein [unclassified Bradyrhizobium]
MADIIHFPAPDSSRFVEQHAVAACRALLRPQTERLQQELQQWRNALDELDQHIGADPSFAALLSESAKVRALISAAESALDAIF